MKPNGWSSGNSHRIWHRLSVRIHRMKTPEDLFRTRFLRRLKTQRKPSPFWRRSTAEQGGTNIGYVQIVPIGGEEWEIGYHIAKKHTGNGYATEAVKAFLPVAAEMTGVNEVQGICLADNKASKQVLLKCGFIPVFEGTGDYQGEKRVIFRSVWTKP